MKEARAASPQRCSSNANSLRGQNSAGFPEIRATSKGIFCDDISEFELTCPARQSRLCGSGCSRSCRPDLGGSGCRVHGRTIQIRDSYCGSPWRQLQLDKVGKSRSFICPVISDLRRLIRPSLPLPFPGQSTPFARQVRASRPPLLRMRSLSTDSLLAARFVWPRPLSVSTYPHATTYRANTWKDGPVPQMHRTTRKPPR
jgi:hypothetical protein